jgi:hypothetical protein
MRKISSKLLVLLIVLAFSVSIFFPETFASNLEDTAVTSIEKAENALASAYQAVLEAEQVDANVSGLLTQLNEAGKLLAEAHMAYRLMDFDEATRSANLCSDISDNVKSKANELRVEVYGSKTMGLWLTMSGSLVSMVAVGFGSFWGWRVFKRRYYKRILRKKPQVVKDES